jgi:hypothetical protein
MVPTVPPVNTAVETRRPMPTHDLADELAALPHLSTGELLARYAELFGQPARTRDKAFLVRKVDRLSRSLLEFARIMEVLDKRNVSFVSVTQQFNTTHSMGRLTLNVLLSFAQFERRDHRRADPGQDHGPAPAREVDRRRAGARVRRGPLRPEPEAGRQGGGGGAGSPDL